MAFKIPFQVPNQHHQNIDMFTLKVRKKNAAFGDLFGLKSVRFAIMKDTFTQSGHAELNVKLILTGPSDKTEID